MNSPPTSHTTSQSRRNPQIIRSRIGGRRCPGATYRDRICRLRQSPRVGERVNLEEDPLDDKLLVSPSSNSFKKLVTVTKKTLISEQKSDPSPSRVWETYRERVAKRNVSFPVRKGVLHRHYKYRRGRTFDQLVVPAKYRVDVLRLCHRARWSAHLGNKMTKERLLSSIDPAVSGMPKRRCGRTMYVKEWAYQTKSRRCL